MSDTLVVQAIHELTTQVRNSAASLIIMLCLVTLNIIIWAPRNRR